MNENPTPQEIIDTQNQQIEELQEIGNSLINTLLQEREYRQIEKDESQRLIQEACAEVERSRKDVESLQISREKDKQDKRPLREEIKSLRKNVDDKMNENLTLTNMIIQKDEYLRLIIRSRTKAIEECEELNQELQAEKSSSHKLREEIKSLKEESRDKEEELLNYMISEFELREKNREL